MEEINVGNVEDENTLEEIRGEGRRRPRMTLLNQKKINRWELDELFNEDDKYEEEFWVNTYFC